MKAIKTKESEQDVATIKIPVEKVLELIQIGIFICILCYNLGKAKARSEP